MARQIANKDKWHKFTMRQTITDNETADLILVGSGTRTYIWAGRNSGGNCTFFHGPATLRKLAYAILKEVGK